MKEDLSPRLRALGSADFRKGLLRRVATAGVHEAKVLVPRRTGNLDRSIRMGHVDDRSAQVLAGGMREVGYAAAVEFGTRPHTIVPKRARVLAWGGSRRLSGTLRSGSKPQFFAMRVHHPGTRAKPYLVPGLTNALRKSGMREGIVKAWNDAA